MKNFAKKATENAAVLGLSIVSLTANAKEAGKEYSNLDFEIKTKLTALKTAIATDPQTYDATADFQNPAKFSKSREKNETDPLTPTEIKKRLDEGKKIIALLGNLKGDELIKKMQDEGITIESMKALVHKLEMVRQHFMTYKNKAINEMYLIKQGSSGSYEGSKEDRDGNQKWEDIASKIKRGVYDIMFDAKTHLAQKEITDAKANGVVTDYTKIAENPKLAEVIDKLHITFQKDEDGVVGVYVNGVYTNFDIVDSESFVSCKIFNVSNGVAFEVKSNNAGNGIVYQMKYIIKGNKVLEFYKEENETEWKQSEKTFKISNENPAKKTLTMNN